MRLTAERHERLDRFLASELPAHSRTRLAELVSEGLVTVDGRTRKPSFALEPGMVVELAEPGQRKSHDLTPFDTPLNVVYEDADMLVVDKPRGMATHPAPSLREPTLVNALLARSHSLSQTGGSYRPGIVHRLDKPTTGLIAIAKNDAAHVFLAKQIEAKTAERRYVALVHGKVDLERFTIDAPLARDKHNREKMAATEGGKHAVTHFVLLAETPFGFLLVVRLETGRTHQIRAHLAATNHPVLGDDLYGPKPHGQVPLQLHAAYLEIDSPSNGRLRLWQEPPSDFLAHEWVRREAVEAF